MNPQAKTKGGKVRKVMHEFGSGTLKSSSGQKVTNPKQAIAIALSEQRRVKKMQEGGLTAKEGDKKAAKYREDWKKMTSPDVPVPQKEVDRARKGMTTKLEPEESFARGGALRAKINKQDTKHGAMDMPVAQLNKYAGMRKGGKVRRYAEGGDTEDEPRSRFDADTLARARAYVKSQTEGGMGEAPESTSTPTPVRRAAPAPAPVRRASMPAPSKPADTEEKPTSNVRATPSDVTDASAVAGRAKPPRARMETKSPEYEAAREKVGEGLKALLLVGTGAALRTTGAAYQGARRAHEAAQAYNTRRRIERSARRAEREAQDGRFGYSQGGKVKEAQMEMRHAKAMKKAGLPKSMVREEMAEAKKYARGGGIESRGKTKGTVIRMASGGSVRGGGCEQRGKTKGRMV